MTTLPLASRAARACPDRARAWVNAAASSAPLSWARWRRIARAPPTALDSHSAACGRKVGAPGRDVEDRDGIAGHGVAHGHAGTDPLVEARAPVLGPADQHRSRRLERRAHPVRPRRPLRPARPRRHVAVPRAAQRLACRPGRSGSGPRRRSTATTPPRLSTSLAIDAAAPPSWANTISCSSVCSEEASSCADAAGASLRPGSTWYCSRQRYQDVATSGRTPRTRSSPARNRSRAAVTAWYRSASLLR